MGKILITGASGFTGKNLFNLLKDSDNEIFLTDNIENIDYQNYIKCDLVNEDAVLKLLNQVCPSYIYNLAGTYTNEFSIDFNSNVLAVKNILDNLIHLKINAKVLLIGSAAEYGHVSEKNNPVNENQKLLPISFYGISKVFQNNLMNYYVRKHELNIVMARTFNIYGKGISNKLFAGRIYQMIEMYKNNQIDELRLHDLDNLRDYIHIDDTIRHYLDIMEHGNKGEVYNVGSGKPLTNYNLLKSILKEEGLNYNSLNIDNLISENTEVRSIYADIRKLKKLKL
tara:strand:+ start:449 stop:1297 length:849 start_codon:yes stop_codon:yes gene_type:complete